MHTLLQPISTILRRLLDVPATLLDPSYSFIYEHILDETFPETMMNVKVAYARSRMAASASHDRALTRRMQHCPKRASLVERIRAELQLVPRLVERYAAAASGPGPGPKREFEDIGADASAIESTPTKPCAKGRRHVRGQQPFIEPATFEELHEPFACSLPAILAMPVIPANPNVDAVCIVASKHGELPEKVSEQTEDTTSADLGRFEDAPEDVEVAHLCISDLEGDDGNPFDVQADDIGDSRVLVASESLLTPLDPAVVAIDEAMRCLSLNDTKAAPGKTKVKSRAIRPRTEFDLFFDSPSASSSARSSPVPVDSRLELSTEWVGKARPRLRRCQLVSMGSPSPRDGRLPVAIGARGESKMRESVGLTFRL
ncbi:hypothetical protein CONPUDRAFT_164496 [Coniophora puteana RWD-64-598 SS2]|uniref:Uncharacterized protein n=1 Tax=Coniophora puteana (strain RWD-64-598) TaxID=741705 RepID=A0A5M3MR89_CONPW|nr:uncharacterized protein CONPUDRAFT_164496 [Coniophora puteana RWD-64-598 SS2]EIW81692.1 hypothetical protein CONPUDRAFT_164496 [Coniophora puteana RWD-64-598 SS2]